MMVHIYSFFVHCFFALLYLVFKIFTVLLLFVVTTDGNTLVSGHFYFCLWVSICESDPEHVNLCRTCVRTNQ